MKEQIEMMVKKLAAGTPFPAVSVENLSGGEMRLGVPEGGRDWQMVVVYRGKHCPLCTRYLTQFNGMIEDFHAVGVDVVAASADPETKAAAHMADVGGARH